MGSGPNCNSLGRNSPDHRGTAHPHCRLRAGLPTVILLIRIRLPHRRYNCGVDAGAGDITTLLKAWSHGDSDAQEQLIPLVYKELRNLARHYRRKSGAGHTLQTTALVNEAYLRLVDINNVDWHD